MLGRVFIKSETIVQSSQNLQQMFVNMERKIENKNKIREPSPIINLFRQEE